MINVRSDGFKMGTRYINQQITIIKCKLLKAGATTNLGSFGRLVVMQG